MPECLFSGHLGGRKNRPRDCALRTAMEKAIAVLRSA